MNGIWHRLRELGRSSASNVVGQQPPWRSKSVMAAALAMLVGIALWIGRADEKTEPAPDRQTPNPVGSANLAPKSTGDTAPSEDSPTPAMKPTSPALFRLGAGYLGGFFIGWSFRRFLKVSILMAGAAVVGIAALKASGLFELDWDAVSGHVSASFTWLKGEAEGVKALLTGYLPSATAGAIGVFRGFLRK
jgi:uncharacterized membrane protein (Fun14 family)